MGMQIKWYSHKLLVGKSNDMASLPKNLPVSYKVKYMLIIQSSNFTPRSSLFNIDKNWCSYKYTHTHTQLNKNVDRGFIYSYPKLTPTQMFFSGWRDKQLRDIHLRKYSSVLKMNKLLAHTFCVLACIVCVLWGRSDLQRGRGKIWRVGGMVPNLNCCLHSCVCLSEFIEKVWILVY